MESKQTSFLCTYLPKNVEVFVPWLILSVDSLHKPESSAKANESEGSYLPDSKLLCL